MTRNVASQVLAVAVTPVAAAEGYFDGPIELRN